MKVGFEFEGDLVEMKKKIIVKNLDKELAERLKISRPGMDSKHLYGNIGKFISITKKLPFI